MRIDSLQLTQGHPRQHRYQMHVIRYITEKKRGADRAETQEERLRRAGIFGSQAEWRGILMVDAVDGTIKWAPVHGSVQPVVVCVFNDEKERDLRRDDREPGEGECVVDSAEFHHWVEEDD